MPLSSLNKYGCEHHPLFFRKLSLPKPSYLEQLWATSGQFSSPYPEVCEELCALQSTMVANRDMVFLDNRGAFFLNMEKYTTPKKLSHIS